MIERRSIIPVFALALVFAATVRADMAPVCRSDAECRQAPCIGDRTCPQPANSPEACASLTGSVDLGLLPIGFLPDGEMDAGQTCEAQPVPLLTEGQGSLSLCLYGLISFGVFCSASSIRKLSFGQIPDWYHTGGPSQIGHSYAITPDCLCATPVYCFIQPDGTARDCQPQYFGGMITSLWRKSQFTPTTLASRGPPSLTH
jgi:hypothetical protein